MAILRNDDSDRRLRDDAGESQGSLMTRRCNLWKIVSITRKNINNAVMTSLYKMLRDIHYFISRIVSVQKIFYNYINDTHNRPCNYS